ncbi:MAG: hypothetical protein ABSH20_31810, partial [Tepidisphaeraceae bacterium]
EVQPGSDVVFNDERQEVTALVTGLRDGEEVALFVSTADEQVVDDRMVMTRSDGANHYRCELPFGSGGFQQDTFYRITAGDATTPQYKLEVQIAPTICVDRIDYQFPAYTEMAPRTIKNQGDIKALEGTKVTIHATANMDIQKALIDLNSAGLRTLPMTVSGRQASGQFTLALDSENPGKPQYDHYQILFTDSRGRKVRRPVQYQIDVDRDLPPEVEIVEPHPAEVRVAEDGQLRIRVHAFDPDFALRHVSLQGERMAEKLREAEKLGLPVLLDRPKGEKAWPKPFDGDCIFRPDDWKLKAGDRVRYWATADDNKEPRSNHSDTCESSRRTIIIAPAGQSGPQDPQNPPQRPDGQPSANERKPEQGDGQQNKAEKGQGDSSGKADEAKADDRASAEKSKHDGQESKSNDPQHGDKKDPGQPSGGGDPNKDQSSSDPSKGEKGGQPNSDEASEQPSRTDPETQKTDALKKILEDKQKQDQNPQGKPDQSSGQKPDQKQDSGQQDNSQQGSPQQGGQSGKHPQGNSGDKKDQSGNSGSQQPQPGQQNNSGQQGQNDQPSPNGQGNSKTSPQQGNSGDPSNGGSQSESKKDSASSSSGDQSSQSGGKGNKSKSSAGNKEGQSSGGQSKPDTKQSAGEKGQQNGSAAGGQESEKQQPGGEQGKDETAGGGASPKSEKK